jgi:hypothetical protein
MKMWKLSETGDTVSDVSGDFGGGELPKNVVIPPTELADLDLRFVKHINGIVCQRSTVEVASIQAVEAAAAKEASATSALTPVIVALIAAINKRLPKDQQITEDELKTAIKEALR